MSGAIRKCLINEWSHRGGAIRRGLDELHFTRRRRGGARPGSTRGPVRFSPWLSPALHPALSPFVPYCSLPVQFSRPLCLGSLTSAVSLIRASQPLQQGVGAPSPGMAPDKQLETLVTESVISKGKAETNHQEPGGTADNKSHCYWGPLHYCPPASATGTQGNNVSIPQSFPSWSPEAPSPCKLSAQNPFLSFITLSGNCSGIGVPDSLGAPESRHSVSDAQHKA